MISQVIFWSGTTNESKGGSHIKDLEGGFKSGGSSEGIQVYTRYFKVNRQPGNGKHANVCSPKQVITIHCDEMGTDPEPMIAEYLKLQKERQEREAEERRLEREAKGKLEGDKRERTIERFRAIFGELKVGAHEE